MWIVIKSPKNVRQQILYEDEANYEETMRYTTFDIYSTHSIDPWRFDCHEMVKLWLDCFWFKPAFEKSECCFYLSQTIKCKCGSHNIKVLSQSVIVPWKIIKWTPSHVSGASAHTLICYSVVLKRILFYYKVGF